MSQQRGLPELSRGVTGGPYTRRPMAVGSLTYSQGYDRVPYAGLLDLSPRAVRGEGGAKKLAHTTFLYQACQAVDETTRPPRVVSAAKDASYIGLS